MVEHAIPDLWVVSSSSMLEVDFLIRKEGKREGSRQEGRKVGIKLESSNRKIPGKSQMLGN